MLANKTSPPHNVARQLPFTHDILMDDRAEPKVRGVCLLGGMVVVVLYLIIATQATFAVDRHFIRHTMQLCGKNCVVHNIFNVLFYPHNVAAV